MTDTEQIRRLLALYCVTLDDRRYDEWTALFVPDGLWMLGERAYHGRAQMKAYMDKLLQDRPARRTRHTCSNLVIDLQGDGGQVTSDLALFAHEGDEPWALISIGRYYDKVQRVSDSEWQFVERRLVRS